MGKSLLGQVAHSTKETFKSFDMYPSTINFTYQGKEAFTTLFGGLTSLLIKIVILAYAYSLFIIMIRNQNSSKSVNAISQNILKDDDTMHLNTSDFYFAVRVYLESNSAFDVMNSPTYFSVKLYQLDTDSSGTNQTEIGLSPCGSNFKYDDQAEATQLGISNFYCPNSSDFRLLGSVLSTSNKMFSLSVSRCSSGCTTTTNIDNAIKDMSVVFYMVNSYFDFEDYNDPIKNFIDDRFYFQMMPGYTKNALVYLQNNEAEDQDSYFAYSPGGKNSNLVEIGRPDLRIGVENGGTIFQMNFLKDKVTKSYERSVFTILDLFGNIGGVLELFSIAGGVLVGFFSSKMFNYSVLSSIYQVEDQDFKNGDLPATPLQVSPQGFSKLDSDLETRNKTIPKESNSVLKNNANNQMRRRLRYSWNVKDFLYNCFSHFSLLYCCKKKTNKLTVSNRYKLYEKGEERLAMEFDAIKYTRSIKRLETLVASIFDYNEKFMLDYQKCNVLSLDSSSDSEEDENEMPSIFSKDQEKVNHREKVDSFMRGYNKDEWTDQDYQLMNGVLKNKALTNKQTLQLRNLFLLHQARDDSGCDTNKMAISPYDEDLNINSIGEGEEEKVIRKRSIL